MRTARGVARMPSEERIAVASTNAAAGSQAPLPRPAREPAGEERDREAVEHEEGAGGRGRDVEHALEAAPGAHQAVEVRAVEHAAQRAELLAPHVGARRRGQHALRHLQRRAELAQHRRGAEREARRDRQQPRGSACAAAATTARGATSTSASAAAASGTAKSILL